MARRFLLRRAQVARQQAQRDVEASVEAITTLVALATSLADRMDAMPSAGLDRDRERRDRVSVLRRTAEAGRRNLATRARSGTEEREGQRRAEG
jgi:hypothetical protein